MFTIYSIIDGKIEKLSKVTARSVKTLTDVWVDIAAPTSEDLATLAPLVEIPEDVMRDIHDINEIPKLDKLDDASYILIQTPVASTTPDSLAAPEYTIMPMGIMITSRCLVTISANKSDVIVYLEEKLKNISHNRLIDTSKPSQMASKLFLFTAKMYLRYLKNIYNRLQIPLADHQLDQVDYEITDLLKIEKSLVYFDTSLRSNYIIMEKITSRQMFSENEENKELMDDATQEMRQAAEVVKVYAHIVEDVRNALSSLISNNLTRTVNWLTRVTLIFMIPTFVGTLYGMNVPLPFADSHYPFWIAIGVMAISTVLGIFWLRIEEHRHMKKK